MFTLLGPLRSKSEAFRRGARDLRSRASKSKTFPAELVLSRGTFQLLEMDCFASWDVSTVESGSHLVPEPFLDAGGDEGKSCEHSLAVWLPSGRSSRWERLATGPILLR